MVNEKNERLESALIWCKKNKLRLDRLNLFNRERKKRLAAKGNLGKKEFKEMCKKAGVGKGSLCKTIFTENL